MRVWQSVSIAAFCLVSCYASLEVAKAEVNGDCWFDSATGARATMVIPVGAGGKGYIEQSAAYNSGHANVPGSGQNFFRDANGNWINSATGAPAIMTIPVGAGGKGYIEQSAAYN